MFKINDGLKVAIGLCVGLAVIMYLNPPHTICDSKKEAYIIAIKNFEKPFGKKLNLCRDHTDTGGCLPFFEVVGKLLDTLDEVGGQCRAKLADDKLTLKWLNTSMELIVRAAWGSKAPASYQVKNGWLDMNQVATFCKLKKSLTEIYSDEAWLGIVNYLLNDMPGAMALGRNEAWARSILSDACKY